MRGIRKKSIKKNIYERHYYRERNKKIIEIMDADLKNKIDTFIAEHDTLPPMRTTRESGYSQFVFPGKDLQVNESLLGKEKTENGHAIILSRLKNAPKLPVSCLASSEHIVSMQSEVEDFKSEFLPATKKQVVYQILVKIDNFSNITNEKSKLLKTICKNDDLLTEEDITLTYHSSSMIFLIEIGTQVADIQHTIRNLCNESRYHVQSCEFANVHLNEGICLLKPDASNPIHALVNIAEGVNRHGKTAKFFLERDAGQTSGKTTDRFQDRNWTFNFFTSLADLRLKTNYPEGSYAIKICKRS